VPFNQSYRGFYRDYYEPSQEPASEVEPTWTDEPAEDFYRDQHPWRKTGAFGAGVAGLIALGFVPTRQGKRVWDFYASFARAVEEYSPGHILRTFQMSTLMSPFEKATQNVVFSPEILANNQDLKSYFAHLLQTPEHVGRIGTEGFSLREGKLFWGTGNEVALEHAAGIRAAPGSASWVGRGWSVAIGGDPEKKWQYFWTSKQPIWGNPEVLNKIDDQKFVTQIIGGRTRREYAQRWLGAFGTEMMGRFNRLLEAPAGFPIVENIFDTTQKLAKKIFKVEHIGFGVRSGTGGQMLGRFMGKYGVALPLAYMGYKTLDWMMDKSTLTKGTIFEEGLSVGIATAGVKANLALSHLAEWTGGHWYREKQEEIAPGSTSLSKLLAFPLMGGLAA